jgi:hypothetical protein
MKTGALRPMKTGAESYGNGGAKPMEIGAQRYEHGGARTGNALSRKANQGTESSKAFESRKVSGNAGKNPAPALPRRMASPQHGQPPCRVLRPVREVPRVMRGPALLMRASGMATPAPFRSVRLMGRETGLAPRSASVIRQSRSRVDTRPMRRDRRATPGRNRPSRLVCARPALGRQNDFAYRVGAKGDSRRRRYRVPDLIARMRPRSASVGPRIRARAIGRTQAPARLFRLRAFSRFGHPKSAGKYTGSRSARSVFGRGPSP